MRKTIVILCLLVMVLTFTTGFVKPFNVIEQLNDVVKRIRNSFLSDYPDKYAGVWFNQNSLEFLIWGSNFAANNDLLIIDIEKSTEKFGANDLAFQNLAPKMRVDGIGQDCLLYSNNYRKVVCFYEGNIRAEIECRGKTEAQLLSIAKRIQKYIFPLIPSCQVYALPSYQEDNNLFQSFFTKEMFRRVNPGGVGWWIYLCNIRKISPDTLVVARVEGHSNVLRAVEFVLEPYSPGKNHFGVDVWENEENIILKYILGGKVIVSIDPFTMTIKE